MNSILLILLLIGVVLLLFWLLKLFKIPKIGCVALVTGGVKTGKSMLSVWLAIRRFKRAVFAWKVKCLICRLLRRSLPERPRLYSNVPLAGVEYVLIPVEILERQQFRPAYKSVLYIQEASLLADSMYFKDMDLNERLLLFNKLIGHETKGGYLIYDTQAIADNHYAVKRCLSSYFWIHHNVKLPFFCVLFVRELFYSADESTVNTVESDVEDGLKIIVIPKRVWKIYDAYCYSGMTDHLPVYEKVDFIPIGKEFRHKLKINTLLSFKEYNSVETFRVLTKPEEKDIEKGYFVNVSDKPVISYETLLNKKGVKKNVKSFDVGSFPLARKVG